MATTILVIGNGFDKQCGLKSSFKDFYDSSFWLDKQRANPHSEWFFLLSDRSISCWFGLLEYIKSKSSLTDPAWYEVEEWIKNIVSNYLNELEIEVRNKIEDRALYRNETIENELLNGIRNFEKNFKNYLQNELKLNEKDYSHNARKLLENIWIGAEFSEDNLYVLNFNYTEIKKYTYKQFKSFPLPKKKTIDAGDGSFYFASMIENNVHGTLGYEIIIGIDDKNANSSNNINNEKNYTFDIFKFTKTYRKMVRRSWENKIYGNLLPSKNELKQIVFYDHSLGEQDHSYFQSLFDFYDIYNSNIILKFCFGFHHEIFKQVYNLIHKYGESFSNKAHGYNLLHKLLLEERLRLIVV